MIKNAGYLKGFVMQDMKNVNRDARFGMMKSYLLPIIWYYISISKNQDRVFNENDY
jgi:hypothetical protein